MSTEPPSEQKSSVSQTHSSKYRTPKLKLYVAGVTPNSERARHNLEACIGEMGSEFGFAVETIDVLAEGKRAVVDGVIVTPTLIAMGPKRPAVMIGDLSDRRKLDGFLKTARGID